MGWPLFSIPQRWPAKSGCLVYSGFPGGQGPRSAGPQYIARGWHRCAEFCSGEPRWQTTGVCAGASGFGLVRVACARDRERQRHAGPGAMDQVHVPAVESGQHGVLLLPLPGAERRGSAHRRQQECANLFPSFGCGADKRHADLRRPRASGAPFLSRADRRWPVSGDRGGCGRCGEEYAVLHRFARA